MPMSSSMSSHVPHGFEGEYGLGAATAFARRCVLAENDVYSCKIDFSAVDANLFFR